MGCFKKAGRARVIYLCPNPGLWLEVHEQGFRWYAHIILLYRRARSLVATQKQCEPIDVICNPLLCLGASQLSYGWGIYTLLNSGS